MESAKDGVGFELDLIVAHVVVNCMKGGDYTTGIIQLTRLLHIVGCWDI